MSQSTSALQEVRITSNESSNSTNDSQTASQTKYISRTVTVQSNQTSRTTIVEDNIRSIISCIWLLTKETFTCVTDSTNPHTHHQTFTPRIIAGLIVLASILLGPRLLAGIIAITIFVKIAVLFSSIAVGIFFGFNVILILDKFVQIPKYVVTDIGILVSLILAPVLFYEVSFKIVLGLNVVALAQFLFLLVVLAGSQQVLRNQGVYVVVMLLLIFTSSFGMLRGNIVGYEYRWFNIAFMCIYGIILLLVGLPKIQVPAVCVVFIWFGIQLLDFFGTVALHFQTYILLIIIFLFFFCFFVGLIRPTLTCSSQTETENSVLRVFVGCWECHKKVVVIDTQV